VESRGREEGTVSIRRLAKGKGKAKGKGMIYKYHPQNRTISKNHTTLARAPRTSHFPPSGRVLSQEVRRRPVT